MVRSSILRKVHIFIFVINNDHILRLQRSPGSHSFQKRPIMPPDHNACHSDSSWACNSCLYDVPIFLFFDTTNWLINLPRKLKMCFITEEIIRLKIIINFLVALTPSVSKFFTVNNFWALVHLLTESHKGVVGNFLSKSSQREP